MGVVTAGEAGFGSVGFWVALPVSVPHAASSRKAVETSLRMVLVLD